MLPGKTYKPEEFLQIFRKRIWLVAVPWALIAAGTAGVARLLPDQYRAQAVIQVVPPRVPDTIMKASTTASLTDRLRATEATILSRTRLENLVKEFNLYPEQQKTHIMEDIVVAHARDIRTAPLKGDVFQVQYTGRNPVTVMKVTERLASLFLEESLKDGTRRAEGTSSFVEAEVEEKHRQLLEIEERLTRYQLQNSGELPTQVGSQHGGRQQPAEPVAAELAQPESGQHAGACFSSARSPISNPSRILSRCRVSARIRRR